MVKKAVIPAAGFGTRFLPATKCQPKEMMPIVDTPVIQYVVEEAAASGISDILMIIGKGKRAIEEHFDRNFELERELAEKNKEAELATIRHISELADVHFVWQKEMNGLGDAIRCARHHVGDEPFAVLLGDTVVESESDEPVTRQLVNAFERYRECVVALEAVERSKVTRYGIIGGQAMHDGLHLIKEFVEKPSVESAPSNLAIASRYVLTADIFDAIEKTGRGKNNEIQLTDALRLLLSDGRPMYGLQFKGTRYDVGNKLDFIRTNLLFALKREDLKQDVAELIKQTAADLS